MIKPIKLLMYRLIRRDFGVLDCRDVTDQFIADRGERFYYVEYYYRGRVYRHHIKFNGKWSPHPRVRRLQEYCFEKSKPHRITKLWSTLRQLFVCNLCVHVDPSPPAPPK
jgi:hypothetical protein